MTENVFRSASVGSGRRRFGIDFYWVLLFRFHTDFPELVSLYSGTRLCVGKVLQSVKSNHNHKYFHPRFHRRRPNGQINGKSTAIRFALMSENRFSPLFRLCCVRILVRDKGDQCNGSGYSLGLPYLVVVIRHLLVQLFWLQVGPVRNKLK